MLTAGLTFGMLTGCGGEEKKTYDQACADQLLTFLMKYLNLYTYRLLSFFFSSALLRKKQ